jgi:protein-disulfide isomerase
MKSRLIAALAVLAAVVVGGLGYLVGGGRGLAPAEVAATEEPNATPIGPEVIRMAEFSDDQRAEMEGIIRNYLIANPEIIRDAINELQRKEDQAEKVAQSKTIEDSRDLIFSSNRQVVLGNPKGSVTLVEFFDYNCTYCRRAQADMKKLLASNPDLKVVLKEFPVLGDGSVEAARVGIAVQMTAPDKYAAFHDELLGEPGQVNGERALAVAEDLGLDIDAIKAKIDSDEVKATISEVYELAGKLNLTGTPSYVTHKEVVVGAVGYDALKAKLEEARTACGAATC